MYKIYITDLNELKQRLRTELVKLDHASLQQSFISGVVDSSRSVTRLYTFSCNISDMLLWTGFKSDEGGCHSWDVINSGVSFCNNSLVARVRWTYQVLQGSVDTLFRWGGKRLYHFAANWLRKWCTKFRHRTHKRCIGTQSRHGLAKREMHEMSQADLFIAVC